MKDFKNELEEKLKDVRDHYGLEQIHEEEDLESPEFGDGDPLDILSVDETLQGDVLNLISMALQADPYIHLKSTIRSLPSSVNKDNYEEVIGVIEQTLA